MLVARAERRQQGREQDALAGRAADVERALPVRGARPRSGRGAARRPSGAGRRRRAARAARRAARRRARRPRRSARCASSISPANASAIAASAVRRGQRSAGRRARARPRAPCAPTPTSASQSVWKNAVGGELHHQQHARRARRGRAARRAPARRARAPRAWRPSSRSGGRAGGDHPRPHIRGLTGAMSQALEQRLAAAGEVAALGQRAGVREQQAEAVVVGVVGQQPQRRREPVRGARRQRLVGGQAGVAQDGDGVHVARAARSARRGGRARRRSRPAAVSAAAARSWAPSRQPPGAPS